MSGRPKRGHLQNWLPTACHNKKTGEAHHGAHAAMSPALASVQKPYAVSEAPRARTSASLGLLAMSPFSAMPGMVTMPMLSHFR